MSEKGLLFPAFQGGKQFGHVCTGRFYGSCIAAAVHRIHFRTLFNHLFHGEFFVEFASGETVDTLVFIPAVVAVRTVESGVSECHSAALANFFLHIAIYSKHRIKYINVYRR